MVAVTKILDRPLKSRVGAFPDVFSMTITIVDLTARSRSEPRVRFRLIITGACYDDVCRVEKTKWYCRRRHFIPLVKIIKVIVIVCSRSCARIRRVRSRTNSPQDGQLSTCCRGISTQSSALNLLLQFIITIICVMAYNNTAIYYMHLKYVQ